jgi:hypothetical protein
VAHTRTWEALVEVVQGLSHARSAPPGCFSLYTKATLKSDSHTRYCNHHRRRAPHGHRRTVSRGYGSERGGRGLGQMITRLMVLVFIMVALGGCQNPGRFEAALANTAAMD